VTSDLEYYDIPLKFYSYKFQNAKDIYLVVGLQKDGSGSWWEKILCPFETIEFEPDAGNYTIKIYNTTNTFAQYEEEVNSSKAFLIRGVLYNESNYTVNISISEILSGQEDLKNNISEILSEKFNLTNGNISDLYDIIDESGGNLTLILERLNYTNSSLINLIEAWGNSSGNISLILERLNYTNSSLINLIEAWGNSSGNITLILERLNYTNSSLLDLIEAFGGNNENLSLILESFDYTNSSLLSILGIIGYQNQTMESILEQFRLPHEWRLPQVNYSINDTIPPVSTISASNALGGGINVFWSSTDNNPFMGVSYTQIYFKVENASTWKIWKAAALPTSTASFNGSEQSLVDGDTYWFKCIGVDAAGNVEAESDANVCNITYVERSMPATPIESGMNMMKGLLTDTIFWIAIVILVALFAIMALWKRNTLKKIQRQTHPKDLRIEDMY
jgi:hypothetical protein